MTPYEKWYLLRRKRNRQAEQVTSVTSADTISINADEYLAHTLTATAYAYWKIIGGADQDDFETRLDVLRWSGNGLKPAGTYVVEVQASNGPTQTITVTVT